jgi:hypothetical protein
MIQNGMIIIAANTNIMNGPGITMSIGISPIISDL